MTNRRSAILAFVLLVAPMVLGLGLFRYVAIGWSFLLSFSDARRTIQLGDWIGLDNYAALLADDRFRSSMVMIVLFTAFIVPVTYVLSLGLAVLVNRVGRGSGFFRTTFLIPAAVSYVGASLIWKMALFNGVPSGVANTLSGLLFDADPVAWVVTEDPPLFWLVLITLRLWLQVGLYMVLFLAGLQAIPPQLYEAAAIDGASSWKVFTRVTFPLLRNTSVAVVLLMAIAAIQAFDEFYNIFSTGGSGGTAPVRPPLVTLYEIALGDQNYGVGSAGAFLLTTLIIIVTLVQGRVLGFGKGRR